MRNVETHYLLGIDENHTGDTHYFSKTGALDAINVTNAQFGCLPGVPGIQCAINAGATMAAYAGNGLTSSADFNVACNNPTVGFGYPCAFGGINPNAPPLSFLNPIGRSVYNGLQAKLVENAKQPVRGVHASELPGVLLLYLVSKTPAVVQPTARPRRIRISSSGALDNTAPTATLDLRCWTAPIRSRSEDTPICLPDFRSA